MPAGPAHFLLLRPHFRFHVPSNLRKGAISATKGWCIKMRASARSHVWVFRVFIRVPQPSQSTSGAISGRPTVAHTHSLSLWLHINRSRRLTGWHEQSISRTRQMHAHLRVHARTQSLSRTPVCTHLDVHIAGSDQFRQACR